MNGQARKYIPVRFIPAPLAVDRAGLELLLGLDGKSPAARAKAVYRFTRANGLKRVRGLPMWPVRAVEEALKTNAETLKS